MFIRAPFVERAGAGRRVLATSTASPVLCRQGAVVVAAFHPGAVATTTGIHGCSWREEARRCSGHSKWATIKHQKGAKDKARGKLFAKVLRQVEVAAREGGGDPEANPTLRTMFQKARDASVPMDTIDRAIKRGTGELEGVTYESITYEGYAPGGVAVLVEALTDNRNRTGAEVRSLFSSQRRFDRRAGRGGVAVRAQGSLLVDRNADEEDLMLAALDAGADDLADDGELWRVTTAAVGPAPGPDGDRGGGHGRRLGRPDPAAPERRSPRRAEGAKKVLRLIDALDDHDDVQNVLRQLRHRRLDPGVGRGLTPSRFRRSLPTQDVGGERCLQGAGISVRRRRRGGGHGDGAHAAAQAHDGGDPGRRRR